MNKEQEYWLRQTLNTISNLSDIGRFDLLPTVLELMLIEVQNLVSENCVKEDGR